MWIDNNNKPWKGGKYGLKENHTIMYRRATLLYILGYLYMQYIFYVFMYLYST